VEAACTWLGHVCIECCVYSSVLGKLSVLTCNTGCVLLQHGFCRIEGHILMVNGQLPELHLKRANMCIIVVMRFSLMR
jgi:hypothetical protein